MALRMDNPFEPLNALPFQPKALSRSDDQAIVLGDTTVSVPI